ncbi:MAG: penicillin-binding protein 2 [Gemmatimonadota bacterium]|nr:MAG: penicillin-binding protein 2 [Gemmatimonadota bacterium]
MSWQNPYELTHRAAAVRGVTVAVFAVLVLAFFRVQVLGSDRYEVQSRENRLRPVSLPAPRGLLTDRDGVVLADNVPGYSIALLASSVDSLLVKLDRLAPLLPLDSAQLAAILRRYRSAPTEPVVVLRDAPFEVVSALEEQRAWNPGLVIQSDPKRRYPFADVTAHLVGYVGEVTEVELQTQAYRGARHGTLVGRDGLEQVYEDLLRGRDGVKFAEVDALGRTVREASEVEVLQPEPGQTVRSTIDIDLQRYIAGMFPAGRRGAVVAMEPTSGEVLALYSAPSYDPNAFIGGYDPDAWERLSTSEEFPLFNRATQARYAPASPWKLAVAAMALERGVATMDSKMAMPCDGGMRYYNRYFRCWRTEGHGQLTLFEAIQHSCDVYFYQLGLTLGLTNLLHDAVALGFRERSGIDLPNEYAPQFPPSTEYYNRLYGPRGWTNAVTLNLSIGQGENAQTLINMMLFYSMLANRRGAAPRPHLVEERRGEIRAMGLGEPELGGLREALVAVVNRGTAAGAQIADLHIAGKTGTAQNPQGPDHGWFIAFAPVEEPRVVVGAIIEFAEHGSSVAPLVTRIIARHLLGPDAVPRGPIRSLEMPADSAPDPVPILPDTSLLRGGTTGPR